VKKTKGNLDLNEVYIDIECFIVLINMNSQQVLLLIGRFGRIDARRLNKKEALIAAGDFYT